MKYPPKISSFEKYVKEKDIESGTSMVKRYLEGERVLEREDTRRSFPYVVTVESDYPSMDDAEAFCWNMFGPRNGECAQTDSECPVCPLVINAKTKKLDEDGFIDVEDHSHIGVWTMFWISKTGYDYGFADFCFKDESDMNIFATECLKSL